MSEVPLTLTDLVLEKSRREEMGSISCFQVHMPPSRKQRQKTPYLRVKIKMLGRRQEKKKNAGRKGFEKHQEKKVRKD